MEVLKTSRWFVFQILWILKNKVYISTHQMWRANNIDRVKKICLELKVLMSKFLDIRSSRPKVSCKKGVLKNFAKLIEKYP